jgi:hypothetical protein
MSVKLHRKQTENFVVADEALEDEALESARQLASWPCNDDAFVVRTIGKPPGKSRPTIIDCLALGAVAYYPEVWLHLTSPIEEETGTEHTLEIAAPAGPSRTRKGFVAAVGRVVMRLWN